MEKFEIRPASRVHCTQLAKRLRPSDTLEIFRASGQSGLEALLDSIRVSDEDMMWTAFLSGHPVAMFGANDITPENDNPNTVGGIWMLCSPAIYTNKLDFMRTCQKYLAVMHTRYEYLTNFIDADNVPSMIWLPRLGFLPMQKVPFGPQNLPFIQYVSRRK